MKVKITGCCNSKCWYSQAVGQTVECFGVDDNGEAIVLPHIVSTIDPPAEGDEDSAGYLEKGDFVIIQEDNVQPQS